MPPASLIVMGYGNPGRLDDGLGPAFAERAGLLGLPGVAVEAGYQLTVEDAALVARYEVAVFADAAMSGPPFHCRPLVPAEGDSFSSHDLHPEQVLFLAQQLFGAATRGWLIGLRGYDFDQFGERLSPRARSNLAAALAYFRDRTAGPGWLSQPRSLAASPAAAGAKEPES